MSLANRDSFTARRCGAVTRAEAHVVRLWSLGSWCSFIARRCGAVIQADAHPFPATIFSRPVFLHSPPVRCCNTGRWPILIRPVRAERQSPSRRPACLHKDPIPLAHREELLPLAQCRVLYRCEAGCSLPRRGSMDPAAEHACPISSRCIPSRDEHRPASLATKPFE